MEQTSPIVIARVAPGVRLRLGMVPRSNGTTAEIPPRGVEIWKRSLPPAAAIKNATQMQAAARAPDGIWKKSHLGAALGLAASWAGWALRGERDPPVGGNGGSRVCR